ncbi:MAG: response regulator [Candidatus Aureabacteria bacterium]|nr:response regulator [Candidatus Auribacterota bacterium]
MGEKSILIIDDHGALRYILSFDLQKKGFKTLTAGNGEKGIEIAAAEKPDMILLDAMMPGIDGFETCRRLKLNEVTKNIPIVMVTAKSQRKDVLEGLQSGATSYMVKPFKFEELYNKIVEIVGPPDAPKTAQ